MRWSVWWVWSSRVRASCVFRIPLDPKRHHLYTHIPHTSTNKPIQTTPHLARRLHEVFLQDVIAGGADGEEPRLGADVAQVGAVEAVRQLSGVCGEKMLCWFWLGWSAAGLTGSCGSHDGSVHIDRIYMNTRYARTLTMLS